MENEKGKSNLSSFKWILMYIFWHFMYFSRARNEERRRYLCLWFESRTGNEQKSLKRKTECTACCSKNPPFEFSSQTNSCLFPVTRQEVLSSSFFPLRAFIPLISLLKFAAASSPSHPIRSSSHTLQSHCVILILCIPPACLPTHLFLQIFLPLFLLTGDEESRRQEEKKRKREHT